MTSTGIGRHASRPILEWDEVEMGDDPQDVTAFSVEAPQENQHHAAATADGKDKGTSPWSAMRKLFKR